MKKKLLYSVMALFMCLFAACSQEEIVSDGEQGSNKVSLSVKIPAVGPVSRAAADLPVEGYVMRCIMELVDDKGDLIAGSRKIVAVADGNALFEFTKPSGAYTCLFWADYVKGTDINDTKATIYKAESLKAIDYRLNKTNDLFNNKVADAFCGKLASTAISSGQNVILKRPFTKIAISKADLAKVDAQLNTFTANINSAQGYNIATGKTTTIQTLGTATDSKVTFPTDGETAFSCYVFPANDLVIGNTDIRFTKDGDAATQRKVSITAEQMKEMKPNVAVNLVPKEETPGEPSDDIIKVEIEVDNSFENGGGTTDPEPENPTDPETPTSAAIGDFFYSDGTTSATLDAQKTCVGIVFHAGKYEGDNGVYSMAGGVKGYAVALKDATSEGMKWLGTNTFDATTTLTTVTQDPKSYDGYKNCQSTEVVKEETAFNALAPVKAALEYNVPLTEGKTSGWYLPTVKQLEDMRTNITAINTAFTALGSDKATAFVANNYWSCIIAATGKVYRAHFDSTNSDYLKTGCASTANTAFYVRAILTF